MSVTNKDYLEASWRNRGASVRVKHIMCTNSTAGTSPNPVPMSHVIHVSLLSYSVVNYPSKTAQVLENNLNNVHCDLLSAVNQC